MPLAELRLHIKKIKEIIQEEIKNKKSNYDCLFKVLLNNEIIVYDDFNKTIFTSKNGNSINVNDTNPLIECLASDGKNFYLINNELYDNQLNHIER